MNSLMVRTALYADFISFTLICFLIAALEMVKDRSRGFYEIRGYMCRRVKIAFSNHLEARNFNGLLNFEHKPEPFKDKNGDLKYPPPRLSLMVNPEGGQTLKRRDMKTLSGGEKSFSTVSIFFFSVFIKVFSSLSLQKWQAKF